MTWSPTSLSLSFDASSVSAAERSTLRLRPPTKPPPDGGGTGIGPTDESGVAPDDEGAIVFGAGAAGATAAPGADSAVWDPLPPDVATERLVEPWGPPVPIETATTRGTSAG